MEEFKEIIVQYAEFVAIMLPWVFISALLIAGLEKVIAHFRGADWATRGTDKTD